MKNLTKAFVLLPLLMLLACFGGKRDYSGRVRYQPMQVGEVRSFAVGETEVIFKKGADDSVDVRIYLMGGSGEEPAGIERFILSST